MHRTSAADELYFITLTVVNWACLFIRRPYAECVMDSLRHCRDEKNLEIYAYVLMPNHLHAVVRSVGRPLADTIRDFKTFSAKQLVELVREHPGESRRHGLLRLFGVRGETNPRNTHVQVWENGYYPVGLYSPAVIAQKMNYLHQNPVRAGFVSAPEHWYFSSAHPDNPLGVRL